jgi:hypothetical protein
MDEITVVKYTRLDRENNRSGKPVTLHVDADVENEHLYLGLPDGSTLRFPSADLRYLVSFFAQGKTVKVQVVQPKT